MKKFDVRKLNSEIEKTAQYDIDENNVFGSAYFVSRDGETVYKNCFGKTAPDGECVSEKTIFRIASMTKPITAMATLILIDRGLLSLSDPVKKFLPQFENIHITSPDGVDCGSSKTDMTIMHILTHTSGIGDSKYSKMTEKDRADVNATVNYFANVGLDFEPFTKQVYSGVSAFDVLVSVIETVTGENYEAFLQREIFTPCNMIDTTFIPSEEMWSRMTVMHNKVHGRSVIEDMPQNCVFENFPCTHMSGGAGLVSTLDDYTSFATMLLNKGQTENGRIVSEKTFNLMPIPYVKRKELTGNYNRGLGVRVVCDEENTLPEGSFGWSGAYGTHFWVDPINSIVGVYMKNSRIDGGSLGQSARRFEGAVYNSLI